MNKFIYSADGFGAAFEGNKRWVNDHRAEDEVRKVTLQEYKNRTEIIFLPMNITYRSGKNWLNVFLTFAYLQVANAGSVVAPVSKGRYYRGVKLLVGLYSNVLFLTNRVQL